MISHDDSLLPRKLHDRTHNLVLSQRNDIGFWDGVLETAWAGHIFTTHSPENRPDGIINSIKGELLGEKHLDRVKDFYDLASAYMIAIFFHQVGDTYNARQHIEKAEAFQSERLTVVDWNEKFHFYSTPEYVYSASLAYKKMPQWMNRFSVEMLQRATESALADKWQGNSYILALMGSALLYIHNYEALICRRIVEYVKAYKVATDENNIAFLWFLDTHWPEMRSRIRGEYTQEEIQEIDQRLIELRTKVFRFSDSFITESRAFNDNLLESEDDRFNNIPGPRTANMIELLMLDEVTERHIVSSVVMTREELERRSVIESVFNEYQKRVDDGLASLDLGNHLHAVYHNLTEKNPATWSQAALSCRNILYELSRRLLDVPEESYPYMQGHDGKPMSLAKDREKNRFEAYMHQMGVRRRNQLVVKQLELMVTLMRTLIDESSATGKSATTYEESCSVVLHTYLFLGELERLTKFQIITEIVDPSRN